MKCLLPLLAALALAGCASDTEPFRPIPRPLEAAQPQTRADSVAARIAEFAGLDAWEALPAIAFSFGFEREGIPTVAVRHLWDRRRNRYRAEWPADAPEDSVYVALFSDWPDEGAVYRGGERVDSVGTDEALAAARRRTINDTYWLLAPLKLFDPGVTRTYAPDSSDASTEAIRLSFDDVGITPGDQYWLFADRETGRLERWTFLLENADAPRSHRWTEYEQVSGPRGEVRLATRKEPLGGEGAVLTGDLAAPTDLPRDLFTDPRPRLPLNR